MDAGKKPRVTARSKNPEGSAAGNGKPTPLLRKTLERRPPLAARRRRSKRTRGWPGNETVSQGSGGEHPRGKPCGSYSRPLQHLEKLRSEGKALKRDRVRREWSAVAEQQEGRGRETGTHPVGGMLREGNLESAVGDVIPGRAESGGNRQVGRTQ